MAAILEDFVRPESLQRQRIRVCAFILLCAQTCARLCSGMAVLCYMGSAWAHPMPHTLVKLQILQDRVTGTAAIPVPELQSAWQASTPQVPMDEEALKAYFFRHIAARSEPGQPTWRTRILSVHQQAQQDALVGSYSELTVRFELLPENTDLTHPTRSFRFDYDAVLHQVVNHKALVTIDQDWRTGIYPDRAVHIGVLAHDVVTGQQRPLDIRLATGSWSDGFGSMLRYGAEHMILGVDHMLFLLMLILVAPLAANCRPGTLPRWTLYQGLAHTGRRFLWMTCAFTLGHSLTLAAALYGLVSAPVVAVEVLIALSIAVSAVHAMRPLFAGNEAWVAVLFGWVHGLAFANGLSVMQLDTTSKLLSLVGFNMGLELAQCAILFLSLPLIGLSRYAPYHVIRLCLAWVGLAAAVHFAYSAL